MLKLANIKKDYKTGDNVVPALRDINLEFRHDEFVSVLGPSGCGKTTMLNIIGGLDKYTDGDLLIDGSTTKSFADGDWDAYRNNTIGMVFQSYNLISHLNVLENVAISLTLSGVSAAERNERAKKVLSDAGLSEHLYKRPNQLSGGQMQRVAIARALVNNPKILLADEPTGALDTKTSVQIMELIKKISRDRLVIMVTHNDRLAEQYSDRIIKLVDGSVISDSRPMQAETAGGSGAAAAGSGGLADTAPAKKLINKKTSMSYFTALKLSFKNLLTKKGRTIITSIAGSIGIIGIALILAISSGMSTYVNSMQSDALAGFPVTISKTAATVINMGPQSLNGEDTDAQEFPAGDVIYSYDSAQNTTVHTNIINQSYLDYIAAMDSTLYNSISYSRGLEMNVLVKTDAGPVKKVSSRQSTSFLGTSNGYFNEIPNSRTFIESQYDILAPELGSRYPSNASELVLIVDSYNRLDVRLLNEFGITVTPEYGFADMLGRQIKIVGNDDFFTESGGIFTARTSAADYAALYDGGRAFTATIVGILRVKESSTSELLPSGIGYTTALTDRMLQDAQGSAVAAAQAAQIGWADAAKFSVLTGLAFTTQTTFNAVMQQIGADGTPTGIQIYPKNFDSKDKIKAYLDGYNAGKAEEDKIIYADLAETLTGMISTIINTITIVLAAIAAISLVVSSIMIGIITYVSVIERTKEIGILRAIGARKKDISRVFNAETLIIGFVAGAIGIVVTLLLSIPINAVVSRLVGVAGIASLPLLSAALLIVISMALTLIAGLLPSRAASKKDPVVALRTE
jgi:putative ABC transport system permease protein